MSDRLRPLTPSADMSLPSRRSAWWCSSAPPVRASRLSPGAFRGRPRCIAATSAAGSSPTTRTTRRPPATRSTSSATSPASGCRGDGSPWSTRPTCSPMPAETRRARPRARRAAGGDRARSARAGLRRSATPAGRTGSSARTSCAASATAAPRPARAVARRLPQGSRPQSAEDVDGGVASSAPGSTTTCAHRRGPFDVIGDIHGCRAELEALLRSWATRSPATSRAAPSAPHSEGRRVIFVGDLVDRGPDTPGVLRLAMGMVADGDAFASRAITRTSCCARCGAATSRSPTDWPNRSRS